MRTLWPVPVLTCHVQILDELHYTNPFAVTRKVVVPKSEITAMATNNPTLPHA
jgi:hypothetical protein